MRKWLYGIIAVLALTGIIVYGFVSAPKVFHVDREITVTAYKEKNPEYSQPVTLLLKGVFDEKSKSYIGKITINGKVLERCRLSPEFGLATCAEAKGDPSSVIGMVFASADYKHWSLLIGPSYTVQSSYSELYVLLNKGEPTGSAGDIIMTFSADGREAALKESHALVERWQDRMADRNP
ncbi:hypothetical protein A3842_28715 [Paenibacillus sp. P3E]|uniref:hypothetical protein n=1 Tax=Paenibacillus sp. P3E TaxID=1349435 RepID=UPI00093CD5E9|nr:hypothetical protein [Paenibacillus sp. P3E]OKP67009.1 hypothetical protein A3842_28715 [Paenibacillus sp. P3E]